MRFDQSRCITIEQAISGAFGPLIDVRSEGEYQEATIPQAHHVPLLTNEERARVGTIYRHEGSLLARQVGLVIVAPKLPSLVSQLREIAPNGPLTLFCWRGGLRSKSLTMVAEMMGLNAYRIEGGYKAFRRNVNLYFEKPIPGVQLVQLHGNTGTGKTDLLQALERRGVGIVDLERLAGHRGSVFGQIGLAKAPGQQAFEADLFHFLQQNATNPCIVLECESKRIGQRVIPPALFSRMHEATGIHVYAKMAARVARLVDVYGHLPDPEMLLSSLIRLEARLGKRKVATLKEWLNAGQWEQVAESLLVDYYDPLYRYPNSHSTRYALSVDATYIDDAADQITAYVRARFSPGKEGLA